MRIQNLCCNLLAILTLSGSALFAQAPVLFYSDITSGPSTGGENGNGAYVTIYGNYFGPSQGSSTVTAGGGAMVNCKVWGAATFWYQKLTCQLGSQAASGNLVVTVSGQSSNALPFTVAAGNIYFVSTTGSDSNAGNFTAPWLTLLKARDTMQPGDITYAMNGVTQSTDDGTGWDSAFLLSGEDQGTWCSATGSPRALVAYPGATVTIGNATGGAPDWGLRTSDCQGNYVLAGISFRGQFPGELGGGSNYRIIDSDITCPYSVGSGGGSCFETSQATYIYFYGNHVYNAGATNASSLFQGVYFSTDSNYVDMGWNLVEEVHGCRGVQVHSSPLGSGGPSDPTGHDQYSISIHDNTIHDTQCDGLIVDTVNPSEGPVTIYNNLIYNAGEGPNNPQDSGGWNCINIPGSTANGPAGSGTVEIFNNTLYACGTFTSPPYENANNGIAENGNEALGAPPIYVESINNLIYSVNTSVYPSGVPYFTILAPVTESVCSKLQICPWLFGTNNLLWGAGSPILNLTEIVASVNANPQVVSTSTPDMHLTAGSPAIGAGAVIGSISVFGTNNTARDQDGLLRPAVPSIGAYELNGASGGGPSVSVNPVQANLSTGQTQQFTAAVNGTSNTAVTWSMNPVNGTLSSTGLYTPPSSVVNPTSIAVTATSVADPTASGTATVVLNPSPVSIAVTPGGATLNAGQTQQFTAQVSGTSNTAVTWSLSPAMGSLSSTGLYTAPASITATETVTITATSVANSAASATAKVGLVPPGGYSVSFTSSGSQVTVNWTAPSGNHANDWIGLSSPGAPNYWYTWRQNTDGALTGSAVMTMPTSTGLWLFRYYEGDQAYVIGAVSSTLAVGTTGLSISATPASLEPGATITVSWTAPAGRPAGDAVNLYRMTANNDLYPVTEEYLYGTTSGQFTITAPNVAGQYQFRYLLSGSWVTAAVGPTITVE
jgi:hypothetical protein